MNNTLFQFLVALETSLHSLEVRSSKTELDKLLCDDFIEFGASGRVFNKGDILNHLPQDSSYIIKASNFELRELSPKIIQITYNSCNQTQNQEPRYTLRSSIWKNEKSQWKMLFHQGTVTKQQ